MNTVIERTGFDPAQDADNGNRFLTGNGYMGVRGTIGEAGVQQMTAVNLAGIHHQKGQGWEEPLNAPNPLYVAVKGVSLPENADRLTSHRLALDIADGVFTRESTFKADAGEITIRQERFCAMERVHLLAQRVTITATHDSIVTIAFGVDENVWDIHGPHYETLTLTESDGIVALTGETDDHQRVCTALRCSCTDGEITHGGVRTAQIALRAGHPWQLDEVAAVYTTSDGDEPEASAIEAAENAPAYDALREEQRAAWAALWQKAWVTIEGDERAEFAVNYSMYHLMSIAPRHRAALSVAARGLSGQTYKGAIFWDTEMFMLDFYLACMPEVARHCLEYRVQTLPGALDKAKSYGYAGAFYAWESVEGGKDACTDYNVTDVFTGRPMRTFFRDTQVHISAAVVYGLRKYTQYTGDDSLLQSGGARVVLECARFYMSLISKRILSDTYDLLDVMGPDEYHEHVKNNAYTNEMARMTLNYAVEVCRKYLPETDEAELMHFADAAKHLKHQTPDPKTGLIEQFDGYFKLENVLVPEVRSRLIDPREYWGGAYGVAAQTQVIKQADVIALLYMLGQYPADGLVGYEQYLPDGWQEDLKTIQQPLDFYGQNIYQGQWWRRGADGKPEHVRYPAGHPHNALEWPINEDGLYWGPRFLYERYHTPILITENGMDAHDAVSLDGKVHDPNRQDYMHRYLRALGQAVADGVPVLGYFYWSFFDNFEWAHGYQERFGLVYVNYQTQERILKDSAYWYQQVMATNGENL